MTQQLAHEVQRYCCTKVRQALAGGICEYSPDRAYFVCVPFAGPICEDEERPTYGRSQHERLGTMYVFPQEGQGPAKGTHTKWARLGEYLQIPPAGACRTLVQQCR